MLAHAGMMGARDAAGATIPTAPSGLTVELTGDTSALITWTDNSNNEDQYNLYRQKDGGGFVLHQTLGVNIEEFEDTGLSIGSVYDYKVSAENEVGESAQIGPVSVETDSVPDAPTNLSATTVSASRIDLSWTDNATTEDEYRVYRDGVKIATLPADSTSYEATGLDEGTEYDWKVAAANAAGEAVSNTVSKATKLAQPTNLVAEDNTSWTRITWDDNSSKEQNYEVYRDGTLYDTLGAGATSYDVTCPDAEGSFKVRAIHSTLPDSDFSNSDAGVADCDGGFQ